MQRETTEGRVLLRLTGRFDPASALLLERELVKEEDSDEVVLDFGSVDDLGGSCGTSGSSWTSTERSTESPSRDTKGADPSH